MRRRPNILLVVTDQQRYDTIAALGNDLLRTPTLDRLVREGTAFTRAYTPSPVCVAARCALLTGLPPHVTGCVDNGGMPGPETPSLMSRLADAGYQTHGVGKMHFTPDSRRLWGFESRDTSEEQPGPHDDYVDYLRRHGYGHVTEPHGVRSEFYYIPQPSQLPANLHHTTWCADRAIDFLDRRDGQRPFFLMTSFIKPHPPFENPAPWSHVYRASCMPGPDVPRDAGDRHTYWNRVQNRYKYTDGGRDRRLEQTRQAAYYGCISFIDFHLGRVLAHLGDELDNTLVIFTADHGELMGDYGCYGKRSMHDEACRVPMLVRLPGRFAAGERCDEPASLLDVLPTCLGVSGERAMVHPDGVDLADLSSGRAGRSVVFSQFQQGRYALYMAATRRHKLMYSAPDRREWVFTPGEGATRESLVRDGTEQLVAASLRATIAERFERDGYTLAMEDGRWIDYEPPTFPDDPDSGLLFQDAARLPDDLRRLGDGYQRRLPDAWHTPYLLLQTPQPFARQADANDSGDAHGSGHKQGKSNGHPSGHCNEVRASEARA